MRNFIVNIYKGLLFFVLLSSCQEEEFVSQREYTFVQSGQITEIDGSGATAVFELLKLSPSAIQEYGVEFLESGTAQSGDPGISFLKISQTGSPDGPIIQQRINYDLIDKQKYLVRPFVRDGNRISYGESLVFDSQGVNPPLVTEISQDVLYQAGQIRLKGDFFHSRKELNTVEILGLQDAYVLSIDSVNRQELWFTYYLGGNGQVDPNANYDLKVNSGGKSTIIPGAFSLVLPRIEELSPLSAFVGDKIQLRLNQPIEDLSGIIFRLFNQNVSFMFYPEFLGGGRFQFDFPGFPIGNYNLEVIRQNYSHAFEQEIEIKSSWEVFEENIAWTDKRDWEKVFVGDKLLIWNPNRSEFSEFYSMEAGDFRLKPLPVKPGNTPFNRGFKLSQPVEGRYLYYGLGDDITQIPFRDFYRFDTQSNSWERLTDFPFDSSRVMKSFVFRGKIYLEMINRDTFITFDLTSQIWEETNMYIPGHMKTAVSLDASDRGVFYMLPFTGKFVIYRFVPGQSEEIYISKEGFFPTTSYFNQLFGNHLLILDGSHSYYRADLDTKEIKQFQTLDGTSTFSPIPWVTSKGLLMAFPYRSDENQVENKVYRLVQSF